LFNIYRYCGNIYNIKALHNVVFHMKLSNKTSKYSF